MTTDQGPVDRDRPLPGRVVDRRGFLRSGAALSAGGLLLCGGEAAAGDRGYKVTGWSGDEYRLQHRFRDGFAPRPRGVAKRHEIIVVGGGLSGLSAAFRARQADVLVLEQAGEYGGNARARSYKGLEYNIGSAYLTGVDGEHGALYAEAGLKMTPIPEPVDRWYRGGRWYERLWEDEVIARQPPALRRAMTGLKRAMEALLRGQDYPGTPYHKSTARALALDRVTFARWLEPHAHPELMALVNAYCYSAMGAPSTVISAYGGLNFFTEFLGTAYTFPEGNAHIARALARKLEAAGEGRIRTGCQVHSVVPLSGDRVQVHYHWRGEGRVVEARRVVLATPYFISARLIKGLSAGQRYALGCQHYGSYVVANLCFDRVVSASGYDNWIPSRHAFQDYIPAGLPGAPGAGDGQVISLFAPCRHPRIGRFKMMTRSLSSFATPLVEHFLKVHPEARRHLREVHLTRWGHAFLINRPGMYTRWLPAIRKQIGPIHLAHSDGQGLPAIESSVIEAVTAARGILARWKQRR